MINVCIYVLRIIFLSIIIIILKRINYNREFNKEKNSPFECGFDPIGRNRLRFCMKFFLLGVIFLIFDVEVTLVIPLPFSQTFIIVFLSILMIGLIYE